MRPFLIPLLACFFLCACPAEDPEPWDPSLPVPSGEARAGVIIEGREAGAVFGGLASEGKAGDIKIYNERVRFIIQGAYRSHGYVDTGGYIIDADLARPDGEPGRDAIDDLFFGFGAARLFHANTVEVIHDGSDGGPAHVRSTGKDVGFDFITGVLELSSPLLPDLKLSITNDFILAPESRVLEIRTNMTNSGREAVELSPLDGMMASDEDQWLWAPDLGLGGLPGGDMTMMGAVGKHGEGAMALWPAEGTFRDPGISGIASSAGIVAAGYATQELAPGDTWTLVRYLALAEDTATLRFERERLAGTGDLGTVNGAVVGSDGSGVAGARVHFIDGSDNLWGHAVTDDAGRYSARVPAGSWTAWAVAAGPSEHMPDVARNARYGPFAHKVVNDARLAALREGSAPAQHAPAGYVSPPGESVTVPSGGETTADFVMSSPGVLSISITSGDPIPGAVEVRRQEGDPQSEVPQDLRDRLGIPGNGNEVIWAWTHDGSIELPVAPGAYTIIAGHSWRFSRETLTDLVVTAGQSTDATIDLDEVIPRNGRQAMDSHLHAAPSSDGSLAMEERIIACAATGVDVPVTTDHDRVTDYRPLVEALGLSNRMLLIPGEEVSPVARGHFNAFPVTIKPAEQNGNAEPWWVVPLDTQELYSRVRERHPGVLLHVNHGRSPGLFSAAAYQPATGVPSRPSHWTDDFEMMEIVNSTDREGREDLKVDWFSLLNQGDLKIPTGVSDSHSRTTPCGYGRTDILLGVDDTASVTQDDVVDAILEGRVIVAGGVTLHAQLTTAADSVLPGGLAAGASGTLDIRLDAPDWMRPETLRIYKNGVIIHEEALTPPAADVVWVDASYPVDSVEDAWFAVEIDSDRAMGSIWRGGTPYALTNAFLLDADGNGSWTPPGL